MNDPQRAWCELKDLVSRGLMVRTDSRLVRPGEVFVALRGASVNGEDFIPAALANGAKFIVTSTPVPGSPVAGEHGRAIEAGDVRVLLRPDVPAALGELAAAHFGTTKHRLKLVGITGTNGKTTTAFILEHLLSAAGLKVGLLGTVVYRWPGFSLDATLTTPDCWTLHELIANMAGSDVDVVVMETSSHSIDQNRIAGLEYDVAVLTNVTQDHLDYHGDMETYFRAKARLFREVPHTDKACVVNFDDPYGARLVRELEHVMGYGLTEPLGGVDHLRGTIRESSAKGLTLDVTRGDRSWTVNSGLIGQHNAMNLLAAQGVAAALGMGERDFRRLETFSGVPGRLERVQNARGLDIFVDYAHTPDALENVQRALRPITSGRLVTLFGCGGNRDRTKRPLMARAVARLADVAVLTSDNPRHEDPQDILADARPGLVGCPRVVEEVDRAKAIRLAVEMLEEGDVLLVAGKGHEPYQQIGDEKHPFSDVATCAEAVEALG
jgi:UDP-N-acetylmuramoyl-L-alanyl-D-glutamate--2,6-diaminopimelate ligase